MRVAYLTPSSFRTVNAGALRNVTVAVALATGGHATTIVSADSSNDPLDPTWSELIPNLVTLDRVGPPRSRGLNQIRRVLGGPTTRGDASFADTDAVILYNPDPVTFSRAQTWAMDSGKPVFVDLTEWLTARDLPGGRFSPYTWWYRRFMRRLPSMVDAGLAISSSMEAHLLEGEARALVVPPLQFARLDRAALLSPIERSDRLEILVSGSVFVRGGKDLKSLEILAHALESRPSLASVLSVHVAGRIDAVGAAAVERIRAAVPLTEHGWIDWPRSLELTASVDWLLQLRDPDDWRSRFGFPSKVTEALALGTPVMANAFSDIDRYIVDGLNGAVVQTLDPDELGHALEVASGTSFHRAAITRDALERFSTDAFASELTHFIERTTP